MNEDIKKNIVSSVAKHLGFDEKNLTPEQSEQIMRTVFENSQRNNSDIANVAQDLILNSTLTHYKFPKLNLEGFDKTELNQTLTEENIAEQLKGVESKISSMRGNAFVNYDEIKKPKND